VIVVNGPSADGTTGMVRERDDVDVLVEISDRTVGVARNAGLEVATAEAVAFVDYDNRVKPGWREAVAAGLDAAPVVTGPVTPVPPVGGDAAERGDGAVAAGTPSEPERRRIAGREVAYFEGGNVAFRRAVLRELDGFDEYLRVAARATPPTGSHGWTERSRGATASRSKSGCRTRPPRTADGPPASGGGSTARSRTAC